MSFKYLLISHVLEGCATNILVGWMVEICVFMNLARDNIYLDKTFVL